MLEVLDQRGLSRQMIEILAEVFAPAAAALAVLEFAEERLDQRVGSRDQTHAGGGWRQLDRVAPQVGAVGVEVAQDEVDGFAHVVGGDPAQLGACVASRQAGARSC